MITASSRKRRSRPLSEDDIRNGCRLGLDSHADVHCIGRHARILETFEGRSCNVQPFNDSYSPMTNIQTVNACFAYDSSDGQTFILEVNQALNFTDTMEHSLLCTNQARSHGVVMDDVPIFLDSHGTSSHSVHFPAEGITMSLDMHGPISYLPVRYPTDDEIENCLHLELSCGDTPWDPMSLSGLFHSNSAAHISAQTSRPHLSHSDLCLLQDDLYEALCSNIHIQAVRHSSGKDLTPESLSRLWNISLDAARRTIRSTEQDSLRILHGKISRRVKTKAHQSRYRQLGGYLSHFASDTFKSNIKSTRGNTYTQLFCNRGNFVRCYPMKSKSHAHHALDRFIHEVGVPTELTTDGAKELTLGQWHKTCLKHRIYQVSTEPHSPWQNHAELIGGIVKRRVRHRMRVTNTPVRLWDYCWEYISSITSITASDILLLDGLTPQGKLLGYTPNISEFLCFAWYDWIWFHEPSNPDKILIGRWLGPAHSSGQGLAHHVLTAAGKVVTRSTITNICPLDMPDSEIARRKSDFTKSMESHIGNYAKPTFDSATDYDESDPYSSLFDIEDDPLDDEDLEFHVDSDGKPLAKPDVDHFVQHDAPFQESNDQHIGLQVTLPHQGEMSTGRVIERVKNADGTLLGTANSNPILDTRQYKVAFGNGTYAEYSANVLIENLYAQIDDDGRSHSLLSGISDHRRNEDAVSIDNGFITLPSGTKKRRITTKGWEFKVEWIDGTSSWIPLSDIKESNPIEVAEYSIAHGIDHEPALAWWVNQVLRKRERIIKQVHHRLAKKSLKFGVTVPNSVKEALALDKADGNSLWANAIDKELKNVIVAFDLLEDGESPPAGSKRIPYHFVFDVKMDLTRKARCVAGGHVNKTIHPHATFSSVASRDSVRICLMLAALNDLDVLMADIGNAYLNAPCRERVHVKCGPELFGPDNEGKIAIVVRALYGLKSAGNAWRHHFSTCIQSDLGYTPTKADPDVYRRIEHRPDGSAYYSYLVVYVDDVLCIHHNPKIPMDKLGNLFRLKDGIQAPTMYLGTDIRPWDYQRDDGSTGKCWALGSSTYIKEALKVVDTQSKTHGLSHTSTRKLGRLTPFSNVEYRPELDNSPLCSSDLATVYQNLVGIARWLCELGRIDILLEISLLSQYLAQPRMGHLTQLLNVFYYIRHHNRSWMPLDPTSFDVNWSPKGEEASPQERAQGMQELYPDAEDPLPPDMPKPLGKAVNINVFVDADHAGNQVTRRSHTGIIMYCNLAPVTWYSKRQNTVETSTFGSEFVAMRIATELTESLIYKLRMFGVPIDGPARVFCDNESVVRSSSFPESTLKKKHVSIAYHKVREAVAAGKILIYYESTNSNLADLFTKVLSHIKRMPLIQSILS